jgi:hypothetical protein
MSCWSALRAIALCLPLAACHTGPAVTTFDGTYTGEATNISPPVYNCQASTTTTPMTVEGGRVSFGLFRGWVGPTGTVQMQSQQNTLSGQFTGDRFVGQFQEGLFVAPGIFCTYKLEMTRH